MCVRGCVCVRRGESGSVRSEPERKKERASETPGEQGFCRGFGCSCIITPTADKAYLCLSLYPPYPYTHSHTHTHTHAVYCVLYVSTEAEGVLHRGEKRKYGRGGEGGDAENGE